MIQTIEREQIPRHFLLWASKQSKLGSVKHLFIDDAAPNVVHIGYYRDAEMVDERIVRLNDSRF